MLPWLLGVGGVLLVVIWVAALLKRRRGARPTILSHERVEGSVSGQAKQDPSSVYRGQVCFFDSVEHRDMFEANHHRPIALSSVLIASQVQLVRRIERQHNR